MASIRKEISIDVRPEDAWAALRDFAAVHERLVPGFVTDARMDGDDARIVTFFNGAVARETLEAAGYVVLPAANATEALGLTADGSRRIHLLVTDVIMPHVSGRELAERLAPTYPDVRVLYISGYTNDAIVRHGVQAEETAFLQKPFTPGALLRKVREVLDGPR